MIAKGFATAHYTSHCHGCDSVIRPGQRIKWTAEKGVGVVHAGCPSRPRRKGGAHGASVPRFAY